MNSACDGKSSPAPSLCGPPSRRHVHRVDPRRACGVAPALQSTPRSPHCCRCCDDAVLPLLLFSVPLLLILALSLACSRTRVLSPSPASLAPSRECSLLSFFLSLSLLVRASPTRACSPSLSLSLRARASPLARVLSFSLSLTLAPSRSRSRFSRSLSRVFSPLVLALASPAPSRECSLSLSLSLFLVAAQGPPTSPAVPCLAQRTQCHRSAPSTGRHSASHRVRRAMSRRPSAIVPPLPPAIAPHPVASAAPRRVASRPRGVYTPPRWEQIGSTPATIYPRVLGQLPSCAGLGVRRCNRTMRGVPCCNRSRKRPAPCRKGSQRQNVEGRAASCWAQRRRRAAEGSDEVGDRCAAVIRTSLGYCMRCAQSAAGESTPNPKVQHVHYDTGPRATGNRRACGCCGAPARQRPVRQISRNIAHPGRTENSTPGPMSVLPRQLHQRSHRRAVENIRGGGERTPSGTPSSSRVQIGGRRAAGRLGVSAAHRAVGNKHPKGIR